jgi:hypothetical protein
MFDVHVCLVEGNPWQVESFAIFQQQQKDETCLAHVGLMTASGERLPFAAWVSHIDSKGKRGLSRDSWHQEVHTQLEDSGKEDSLWEKHGNATADLSEGWTTARHWSADVSSHQDLLNHMAGANQQLEDWESVTFGKPEKSWRANPGATTYQNHPLKWDLYNYDDYDDLSLASSFPWVWHQSGEDLERHLGELKDEMPQSALGELQSLTQSHQDHKVKPFWSNRKLSPKY